jgi:uncharacterized protein YdaU (DUF1376 family)
MEQDCIAPISTPADRVSESGETGGKVGALRFVGCVMGKPASPAFQFYPDDFLGSSKVAVMTPTEIGVYVLLLCMDWNGHGITYNPKLLARYCRVTEAEFVEAWEVVGQCFEELDGKLYNPRLIREREKQAAFRAKQKAASDARWDSHRNATGIPRVSSPSPTPAPATTGGRKRLFNREPEPYKPEPFCTECGQGMGKATPDATRLTILHKEGCRNA